jgi:peptide deformylase
MAILQILHYPDPRLRTVAKPVSVFGDEVQRVVADMFETMYAAPGIGLAATQVNIHKRILVTDTSRDGADPRCFINPQIVESRGVEQMDEGCLSVPDVFETVERAEWIRVQAFDQFGVPFELELDGLLAVCVQHEIDHLDGKLFVDRLSSLKRSRIRRKFEKAQKQAL